MILQQDEGPGWRLARDPLRGDYPVLIAGEIWAVELTESEGFLLVEVFTDLVSQYQVQLGELMPQEAVSIEIERQSLWACLEGDRETWSLRLILQGQGPSGFSRGFEVFWPAPAAEEFVTAMRKMWDSLY